MPVYNDRLRRNYRTLHHFISRLSSAGKKKIDTLCVYKCVYHGNVPWSCLPRVPLVTLLTFFCCPCRFVISLFLVEWTRRKRPFVIVQHILYLYILESFMFFQRLNSLGLLLHYCYSSSTCSSSFHITVFCCECEAVFFI